MKKRIVSVLLAVLIVLSSMIQGLPVSALHIHKWKYEDLGNGTHRKYCTGCDNSSTESHSVASIRTFAQNPGCEKDGNIAYYGCKDCGAVMYAVGSNGKVDKSKPLTESDVTIKALGHNYEWVIGTLGHALTCTKCYDVSKIHAATHIDYVDNKDGLTHSKGCHQDGCTLASNESHTWNFGEVTSSATCGVAGVRTYTCIFCSGTKTESITALQHNLSKYEDNADGSTHKVSCTRDGCTYSENKSHTLVKNEANAHSCLNNGNYAYYKCSGCGAMYGTKDDGSVDTSKTMTSESIVDKAPGEHKYVWEAYTESAINHHRQRCTVCGDKPIKSIHVVLTTDQFVYHEEVPYCQQNPHSAYYSCPHDGCDMVFTDTDSATVINKNQLPAPAAHSYVYTVNTLNNGTHTATCSACTHSENLVHTKLTYVAKVAAGCTENGVEKHYVCEDCGAWFKNVSSLAGISVPYSSADFVLNALDHDYVWSTVVDGLDIAHKGVCSRCKDVSIHAVTHYDYVDNQDGTTHSKSCHQDGCTVSSSENHTWNLGEVTEAAQCNSSGIRTYTCLLCPATKKEPIDALQHQLKYTDLGNGQHRVYCDRENCTYSENVAHNLEKVEANAHDCEKDGNYAHWKCTQCGALYGVKQDGSADTEKQLTEDKIIDKASGHKYEWKVKYLTLLGETGTYYHCNICAYCEDVDIFTRHAVVSADSFVYHEEVPATCQVTGTEAYYSCPNTKCDLLFSSASSESVIDAPAVIQTVSHSYVYTNNGNGTCTGNCVYSCGIADGPKNHDLQHTDTTATCTQDGTKEYWYCSNCTVYFSDKDTLNTISDLTAWLTSDGVKSATGHTWTYTSSGAIITATCHCSASDSIEITVPGSGITFDGSAKAAQIKDGKTSVGGIDILPAIMYKGTGSTQYVSSSAAPVNAGTYVAEITVEKKNAAVEFTVAARDITLTVVDVASGTYTYDGTAKTTTASYSGLVGTDTLTYSLSYSDNVNAGTCTVSIASAVISSGIAGNYNLITTDTGTLVIDKATAVIYVDDTPIVKTYGETVVIPVASSSFGSVSCDKLPGSMTEVGTYEIKYTVTGTSNYNGATKTVDVTITPKQVNEPSVTGTYTYTGYEITATVTGKTSFMTESGEVTAVNAGVHTITYTLDANHEWASGSDGTVTWTINKAQAVITVDETPITVTYGETVIIPVASSSFGQVICDKTADDLLAAGSHAINYTVADTDNYFGAKKTVQVKINKLAVNDPVVVGTYTYTGFEQSVVISGIEPYMFEYGDVTGTDAGTYIATYLLDSNHMWADGSNGIIAWKIEKAQPVIFVDDTPIVITYGETVTVPVASSSFGQVVCNKVSADMTEAGSYTITYSVTGTENYLGATKTVDVTVNQIAVNEPTVTGTYTYTGSEQTAEVSGIEEYMTESGETSAVNAGTHTITYTLNPNYKWADGSDGTVTWTVEKAQAIITVDETPITVTYGETVTVPVASSSFGQVICDKQASDMTDAASYTVTYTVAATDNYFGAVKTVNVTVNKLAVNEPFITGTYTYTGSELTAAITGKEAYMTESGDVKAVNAGTYTVTYTLDSNHKWADGSDGTVTWTVEKAQAVITVDETPITVTYGESVKVPVAASNFGKVECDKVSADMTNAGSYVITYTVSGTANYNGAEKTVSVTVNQLAVKEPTVTGLYTYNGSEHTAVITGKEAYMTESGELKAVNAGKYTITYTINSNYKWADGSDGIVTWTVEKAQTVITVDDTPITVTYGETVKIPAATSNYGKVTCDKVPGDMMNAGSYVIRYSVPGAANYNGAEKTVSVTVNQLAVKEPTVTGPYTYTGSEQTAAISGKEAYMTESGDIKATKAGIYTITYKLDNNHKWADGSDGSVTWSIAQAKAAITVDTTEIKKTFGDKWTLPTAVTTFGTVTCDKTQADLENVGTYMVTYTVPGTADYLGDTKILTVKISALAVNEPTVSGDYKYTGKEQTVSLAGVESFMTTEDSLTQTDAGVYTVNFKLDANHVWADGSDGVVTWEIKAVQLTANDKEQPAENKKQTVIVETDEGFPSDIEVIVEITTEASVAEQIEKNNTLVDYNNIPDEKLKLGENEQVGIVFKIKLVRMVNGVAEEIQPSDIAPGTKVRVKMLIPEDVDVTKVTRILHVHSENDIEEIPFDASLMDKDRYYEIEIDRFSEFAFIYELTAEPSDPSDPEEPGKTNLILIIVIIAVIIAAAIVFIWFILGKKKENK